MVIDDSASPWIIDRLKTAAVEELAQQDTKPHLNLIEPRGVLRRVDKMDMMGNRRCLIRMPLGTLGIRECRICPANLIWAWGIWVRATRSDGRG
jgi:hypothetical protein